MNWKYSLALFFYLFTLIMSTLPSLARGETIRLSLSHEGADANGQSNFPDLSQNGRYITFVSEADNLVVGDTNGFPDVFVYDRMSGEIKRVSVASDGTESNGDSGFDPPRISGDGRYVVFRSRASNLVPDDNNGLPDIFIRDTQTNLTQRISITDEGKEANSYSWAPDISADGRFVAFDSQANNLVTGDTNGQNDIFVHDMETGINSRVNLASDGTEANAGNKSYWGYRHSIPMSADDRYIAFTSPADNLVAGDSNGGEDVFVYDRQTGINRMVSVSSTGEQGNGISLLHDMSADGRFVVFYSASTNLSADGEWGLFLHDRDTGETKRISGWGINAALSNDGRYIAFTSADDDLSPWSNNGYEDVFVLDQLTESVTQVNRSYDGGETNMGSFWVAISGDGKYVSFESRADNLVPKDTNGFQDVFETENPYLFSINPGLNDAWYNPETSGQGFWITVYEDLERVALAWLTYDTTLPADGSFANLGDPGHRWLTAVGPINGNQAVMAIEITSGGLFDTATAINRTDPLGSDGTITLTFTNCNSGTVEYDIPSINRQGVVKIQRVAGDNIVVCEAFNMD